MTDGNEYQPPREAIPIYIPPSSPGVPMISYSQQNVNASQQPTGLGSGTQTEWDASTLDGAITWLEEHSKYIGERLLSGMHADIGHWLTAPGRSSPFGAYPYADVMAERHRSHYSTAENSLRTIAEELWQAAQSLREVKTKYETAEQANEMSAAAFEQVFASETATGQYGSASPIHPSAPAGTQTTHGVAAHTRPADTAFQG